MWAGVFSRSTAPAAPPSKLVAISGIITRRGTSSRLRYAPPLAVTPVQRASVLVAFAGIGGTPVKSSAGNEMKLPPPATALSAPPKMPAKNKKMACWRIKPKGVSQKTKLDLTEFNSWRQTAQLLRGGYRHRFPRKPQAASAARAQCQPGSTDPSLPAAMHASRSPRRDSP